MKTLEKRMWAIYLILVVPFLVWLHFYLSAI